MRPWFFLLNPFFSAADSFLMALRISTFHDNVLYRFKNDPFILVLYEFYHPIHLAYEAAYNAWMGQGGSEKSDTLTLNQLLKLLVNTKIKLWDIQIQNVYVEGSPNYLNLLPDHRKPFQSGGQMERLHAVKVLSDKIGTDAALKDVKTDVDSFHTLLEKAFKVQKGTLAAGKDMSGSLEDSRIAMCEGQYANLGALIREYAKTPEKIGQFFDLEAIRDEQQVVFTGQLKAGEVYTIVKHTFGENDEVVIGNNGNTTLKFYLASEKGMLLPNGDGIMLNKGKETILANTLGKLTNTYLTVVNTHALMAGEFSVEII